MAKRYAVAAARARFKALLDQAERGENVIVERYGVQFRVVPRAEKTRRRPRPPLIDYADPAILSGRWRWAWRPGGLQLNTRRKGRQP